MGEKKEYYKKLDYLRIISCIMVLLYHLNILKGGFLAVCTFFALSRIFRLYSVIKTRKIFIKKVLYKQTKKDIFSTYNRSFYYNYNF